VAAAELKYISAWTKAKWKAPWSGIDFTIFSHLEPHRVHKQAATPLASRP